MLTGAGRYGELTLQDAATATGNGTALGVTNITDGARPVIGLQVTGIDSDTITWEATIDGTNWASVQVVPLATGTAATTATANGLYRFSSAGILKFRARISTHGSGTITVVALVAAVS